MPGCMYYDRPTADCPNKGTIQLRGDEANIVCQQHWTELVLVLVATGLSPQQARDLIRDPEAWEA